MAENGHSGETNPACVDYWFVSWAMEGESGYGVVDMTVLPHWVRRWAAKIDHSCDADLRMIAALSDALQRLRRTETDWQHACKTIAKLQNQLDATDSQDSDLRTLPNQ
jgi:hypothetical protein